MSLPLVCTYPDGCKGELATLHFDQTSLEQLLVVVHNRANRPALQPLSWDILTVFSVLISVCSSGISFREKNTVKVRNKVIKP